MIPSDVFPLIATLGLSQTQASVVAECFRLVEIATKEEAERPLMERRRKDRERKTPKRNSEENKEFRGNTQNDAEVLGFPASRVRAFTVGEVVSLPQSEATLPTTPKGSKRAERACRLPVDWVPNEGHRQRAVELGMTEARFSEVLENFRNFWFSEGGARARKLNWDLTFTNRLIDQAPRNQRNNGHSNGKPTIHDEFERIVNGSNPDDDLFTGAGGEIRQSSGRMLSTRRS